MHLQHSVFFIHIDEIHRNSGLRRNSGLGGPGENGARFERFHFGAGRAGHRQEATRAGPHRYRSLRLIKARMNLHGVVIAVIQAIPHPDQHAVRGVSGEGPRRKRPTKNTWRNAVQ